ncbi:MAG: ATP-binding cassette domain-containing protein [Oscillospiraceae bacterium]
MEQIDKAFDGKQVLQNVTLDIPDGQICGIFGKSGIGKSTLAKVLCGICPPDGGADSAGRSMSCFAEYAL